MKKNSIYLVKMAALLLTFVVSMAACSKTETQTGGGAAAGGSSGNNAKAAKQLASALDKALAGGTEEAAAAAITAFADALKSANQTDIAGLNAKASPGGDFTYDLNEAGDGIIIKQYTGNNPVMIIPAEIEGYPVVQIGEGYSNKSFAKENTLQVVVIPENVQVIKRFTFQDESNLRAVTFPASLTIIGGHAFEGTALESVDLSHCTSLKVLGIDPSSDSYSGSVFFSCKNLKTVKLPDTLEIIDLHVFLDCGALTDINIPSGIKEIGASAFFRCTELYNLTIPDTVTKITFLSSWDYYNREVYEQFEGCGKLPLKTRKRLQDLGYTGEF